MGSYCFGRLDASFPGSKFNGEWLVSQIIGLWGIHVKKEISPGARYVRHEVSW